MAKTAKKRKTKHLKKYLGNKKYLKHKKTIKHKLYKGGSCRMTAPWCKKGEECIEWIEYPPEYPNGIVKAKCVHRRTLSPPPKRTGSKY